MSNIPPSFSSFPPTFSSFPDLEDPSLTKPKVLKPETDNSRKASRRDEKEKKRRHNKTPDNFDELSRKDSGKAEKRRSSHKEERDRKSRRSHRRDDVNDAHHLSAADLFIQDALAEANSDTPHSEKRNLVGATDVSAAGSQGLYIEDRKGDDANLRYDSLHAYAVPKYRRMGYGEVIGFPPAWKLTRGEKGEVALRGESHSSKHTLNRKTTQIAPAQIRKLIVPTNSTALTTNSQEGFIPLPGLRRKGGHSMTEPAYRSVTTAQDPDNSDMDDSDPSSPKSDAASDASEAFTVPYTSTMHTNARLTSLLKTDPTSTSTWLELLEHSIAGVPTSEARSDLAVNIIEKAFSAHPANKRNAILRCRYLLSGAIIWPANKLEEEWERALKLVDEAADLEDRMNLWMDHLNWRLKVGGVMRLETAVQRLWILLRSERSSGAVTLDRFRLRVLWRCCTAFSEAGYKERACAMFQAQMELVLYFPPRLRGTSLDATLDALEDFWEAEAPRIGEPNAGGWAGWEASKNAPSTAMPSNAEAAIVIPSEISTKSKDPYARWAARESQRDASGDFPLRTSDEDEDPYTTILFSDIRPFLFSCSTEESGKDLQTLLPLTFMHFLGLHFPGLSSLVGGIWDSSWSDARFGRNSPPSSTVPLISTSWSRLLSQRKSLGEGRGWEVVGGTVVATEKRSASGWGQVKEWGWNCVLSPLDGYGVRGEGRMWESEEVASLEPRAIEFIRQLFQQVSRKIQSTYFDEVWLTFEAAFSVKTALKVSRALLSKDRDSIPRWTSHAKLERLRDKISDARKVYETSLDTVSPNDTRPGVEIMFWDWAEMEWLAGGEKRKVLDVILKSVGVTNVGAGAGGASMILRGRKVLEERIRSAMNGLTSSGPHREGASTFGTIVALINTAALLELVSGGDGEADVIAALQKHDIHATTNLGGAPFDRSQYCLREALAFASSRLLYHHTRTLRTPIPPITLRRHVESAVREFPDNTVLLGIWLESEKGEMIWGRVRQVVGEIVNPKGEGVIPTRALWGTWQGIEEISRVRNMLNRVIEGERHPPLRRQFKKWEIETWVGSMMERQIRIREDIEDYLQAMRDAEESERDGSTDADEGEGGDEELEGIVNERRRLAPY
ncbi:hypothetical protein FRB98_007493 [Tulasnella sp. 332]|nr:hypothetical protein FRB98_007493 [Tulasnella sp. 332]